MKAIERALRRTTKMGPELKDLTYDQRFKTLNLPSLKYSQIRCDLIKTFKIIHKMKIEQVDPINVFIMSDTKTRNSELKLYKAFAKIKIRSNFLIKKVNNLWICL